MENSKYYTPELEEFHVGFEYEYYTKDWVEKDYKYTWCKFQYNVGEDYGNDVYNLTNHIQTNQVRVKYLDREDIESLGWEFNYKEEGNHNTLFYFGKHSIILSPNHHWCVITMFDRARGGDHTAFVGVIKNKSELKRLMIQLGIKEVKN